MDYFRIGHWAVSPVSTGLSTDEPITVASLRAHLRLPTSSEASSDDPLLLEKIGAARRRIEERTQRAYMRSQFDLSFDRFPCDARPIRLPRWPLVSVESVTYFDTDGTSQDFGSSGWFVDSVSEPGRLCLNTGATWPSGTRDQLAGRIRFTAGYSSTPGAGIPDPLLEAVRKLAAELYENREAASLGNSVNEPLPYGVDDLIAEYVHVEFG